MQGWYKDPKGDPLLQLFYVDIPDGLTEHLSDLLRRFKLVGMVVTPGIMFVAH